MRIPVPPGPAEVARPMLLGCHQELSHHGPLAGRLGPRRVQLPGGERTLIPPPPRDLPATVAE